MFINALKPEPLIRKRYGVFLLTLNNVQEELTTNNWEMKAVAFSKKIRKQYIFNLVLHLQIDSFTFIGEVIENDIKYEILILNSRPSYFVMYYLFGGYKIENNLIIIGITVQL